VTAAAAAAPVADMVRDCVHGAGADFVRYMTDAMRVHCTFGSDTSADSVARNTFLLLMAASNGWSVRAGEASQDFCLLCGARKHCTYDVVSKADNVAGRAGVDCALRFDALQAYARLATDVGACVRAPRADSASVIEAFVARDRAAAQRAHASASHRGNAAAV